jgi:phosphogluconate dehydratase
MPLQPAIAEITERIRQRSHDTRADYLARMEEARRRGSARGTLSCGNLAHGFAAAPIADKLRLRDVRSVNLGVVTAYNDVLSAHQPFARYPDLIRQAARELGCTAQVAGGVPAMCDGVTQGQPGMELSLFSRDVIAMATAISLSHNMFDAALCLGTCDKIVPGLMIGALSFGHLPVVFAPGGPMPSGIPNKEKARVRELHAQGKVGREELLEAEAASYHAPGTCTFYGTANSNQMLMELMGVHVPGTAFVTADTPLRDALTRTAAKRACALARDHKAPLSEVIDERAVVNGMVGLMATGGSTNHTLHLVAMARAAGILIDWADMAAISAVTPLLTRIYPNGSADVNQFHDAGGMAFLTRELLRAGLLHPDTTTVGGDGLAPYALMPTLDGEEVVWIPPPEASGDPEILRGIDDPFQATGGLKVLEGELGRSVIKVSAVAPEHRVVEAPAAVFDDQDDFLAAYRAGALDRDFVAVIRFQGPRANGMPELHKLTPALSVLQGKGRKVALVTDGRMSGASGRVPAAIHLTPEALDGGPIARVRDGDLVRLDAEAGRLELKVEAAELAARTPAAYPGEAHGVGRELFAPFRRAVGAAESGASVFF